MALFLQEHGYRVGVLVGGYNAWQEAGLPLDPAPGSRRDAENAEGR